MCIYNRKRVKPDRKIRYGWKIVESSGMSLFGPTPQIRYWPRRKWCTSTFGPGFHIYTRRPMVDCDGGFRLVRVKYRGIIARGRQNYGTFVDEGDYPCVLARRVFYLED